MCNVVTLEIKLMLVLLCVVSLQITKDEFFAEVLRDVLLYVSRDLGDKVYTTTKFTTIFVIALLPGPLIYNVVAFSLWQR